MNEEWQQHNKIERVLRLGAEITHQLHCKFAFRKSSFPPPGSVSPWGFTNLQWLNHFLKIIILTEISQHTCGRNIIKTNCCWTYCPTPHWGSFNLETLACGVNCTLTITIIYILNNDNFYKFGAFHTYCMPPRVTSCKMGGRINKIK